MEANAIMDTRDHCLNCGHDHEHLTCKCSCVELSVAPPIGWESHEFGYEFHNQHLIIEISERPVHCNRGRWMTNVHHDGCIFISEQDTWPRYYFSLDVAMSEMKEWLRFRENQPDSHYSHLLPNCPNRNDPLGRENEYKNLE